MPKRLIWFSVLSLVYLAVCFSVHLILHKSTLELSSYRTMIASISGRIHDPMSQYELQHLSSQLAKVEFGGDLRALGLNFEAQPLATYLKPATFDMTASLKLLNDGRLRASQVKFDSLASKLDTAYLRRTHLLSTLAKIAGVVTLALLFMFAWLWRRARGHWSHEISTVNDEDDEGVLSFESYLQSVAAEEVEFAGHRASLSCNGFESHSLPSSLKDVVEFIAEQFVRNAIEHGGRPAEQRLLHGKTDYISIRVTLEEQDNYWQLSVWDNGEGLDANEILRRALELKLVDEGSVSALAPEQRIKLVFLRGFSTRKQTISMSENDKPLSELRVIAKQSGGVISIQNQKGGYCQFSIRFPKS